MVGLIRYPELHQPYARLSGLQLEATRFCGSGKTRMGMRPNLIHLASNPVFLLVLLDDLDLCKSWTSLNEEHCIIWSLLRTKFLYETPRPMPSVTQPFPHGPSTT